MLRGHSVSDFADVAAHVDSYLRNVWNGTPMTAAYTLGAAFKRTLHVKNLGTELAREELKTKLKTCPWVARGARRPKTEIGFRSRCLGSHASARSLKKSRAARARGMRAGCAFPTQLWFCPMRNVKTPVPANMTHSISDFFSAVRRCRYM